MRLTVLGCGRWGTFLASYHCARHQVALWGRPGSRAFAQLAAQRKNEYLTLPQGLMLQQDLGEALAFADTVVISISAQQLRVFAAQLQQYPVAGKTFILCMNAFPLSGKTFILCMKGLECETGKRLTQVFLEEVHQPVALAVWAGPGHVQDFLAGIPNCMVVDSADPAVTERIVRQLGSDLIRLYKGGDLIGTEVGAAAKNVIGIAAGMLDGVGYSSLKGALMARGAREIARLIRAMGGNELSAYGLCHLGDYEATLFSPHSHNRLYGEYFVQHKPCNYLAEGAETVKALVRLGEQYQVDLPICKTVYCMLYEEYPPEQALPVLFARSASVGGQQFPVHWGGDCSATYPSMAETLRGGLSFAMSGFAFWSHDISGFESTAAADLYKRWAAFGLLSTHSRLHGSESYRVPWLFDEEACDVVRSFAQLKCRLMPYLYQQAVEAHETGVPVMRPMALEFFGDPATAYLDRQYMLGGALLAAPIFREDGAADYYLPSGLIFWMGASRKGGAGFAVFTIISPSLCTCGKTPCLPWAAAVHGPTMTIAAACSFGSISCGTAPRPRRSSQGWTAHRA